MLEYAAVLPSSPLLIADQTQSDPRFRNTRTAIKEILADLARQEIQHIITLGTHPRYLRAGFSAYVAPEYTIAFKEFGDLVTSLDYPVWWDAYYCLQENAEEMFLEPIPTEGIDYQHGIPLFELYINQHHQIKKKCSVLAINDQPSSQSEEKQAFGKFLAKLDDLQSPYALILCGNLYATLDHRLENEVHQMNDLLVKTIGGAAKNFDDLTSPLPSVANLFTMVRESLAYEFAYKTLALDRIELTDLYTARWQRKQ